MEDRHLVMRNQDGPCEVSSPWLQGAKKHPSAFMHINPYAEAAHACNSESDRDHEMVQHCSICGKGFYHIHDLQEHELTHMGGGGAAKGHGVKNSLYSKMQGSGGCGASNCKNAPPPPPHCKMCVHADCRPSTNNNDNKCTSPDCDMCDNCDGDEEESDDGGGGGGGDGCSKRLSSSSMDTDISGGNNGGCGAGMNNPFACDLCGEKFSLRGNMLKHRQAHGGQRPYTCSVCGKQFTLRGNMKKHQAIHDGLKPFHCDVCGRSFGLRGNLQQHQVVHTGVKPYNCSVCGRQFSLRGNMEKHKRIHSY